jgi:hypothetical protein
LADVRRVCARFGIVVTGDTTDPQAALAIVGKAIDRPTEGLLSLREAAALLDYTEKGLRKIVARRGIEYFQSQRWGPIKFKREWLDDFIESRAEKRPVARPQSKLSYDEF